MPLSLLLATLTILLYLPVSGYSFVGYDDDNYVTRNPHVQQGLAWSTVTWALTSTEHDNWHPLTWMSHALDWELYGQDASGHHVTNLVLHAINAALLFLLLALATGATGRSLLVAALFAVHPFNVESVAWIAERKNVLSTMFLLLTLGAYGWYSRQPSLKRYLAVIALFTAGLASKAMVVTLPCALLLLDVWPLRRIRRRPPASPVIPDAPSPASASRASLDLANSASTVLRVSWLRAILEKLPLLLLSAGASVLTVIAQRRGGAMKLSLPLGVRLENAAYAYAMYVWKAFWPVKLAPFYPHPGAQLGLQRLELAVLCLAVVTTVIWRQRTTRPYLMIGWLWFLGTLVPVIGLVQVGEQAMADRYAYVPLIGIFLMAVWGGADLAGQWQVSRRWRMGSAAAVLAVLAVLTWRQTRIWRSSYDLWSHTVAVTHDNYTAEDNLGGALLLMGRTEEAVLHFQNAARINLQDPTSRLNLAAVLAETGHRQEAIAAYHQAIPLVRDPRVIPFVYENIGLLYANLGDYAGSRESYLKALEIEPGRASSLTALANVDLTAAMATVAQHPSAEGYLRVGRLLEQAGHITEARSAYARALGLDPRLEEARAAIAALNPRK